jgi:hypothetical protein
MGYAKGGQVKKPKMYEEGGPIEGPGTGTSDSITAKVSNGEYIIPADVAQYLGTKFLDGLVANAQLEMGGGNMFADMATNEMGEMEPANGPGRPPRRA